MDHWQMYVTTPIRSLAIPVIEGEGYEYDGLGFDGFPERVGFQTWRLWDDLSQDVVTDRARLSMLQNWMYFGLAHGILGVIVKTPVPLRCEFLISRGDEPVINTNQIMMTAMVAWKALHERYNERKASQTLATVSAVLREAQNIIKAIMLASDRRKITYLIDDNDIPNGQRIVISILLLCEQFHTTLTALYGDDFDAGRHISWPVSEQLEAIYQKLLECCRSELGLIMRAESTPNSFAMFSYALSQTLSGRDHSHCTDLECKADTRQRSAARICVTHDCVCIDVGLDEQARQELELMIKEGHIPMLVVKPVLNGTDTIEAKLELLVHDPNGSSTTCVAISHVWADGLGSRSDGKLPSCQLLKLQQHANNMPAELAALGIGAAPIVGFWIDSICVPSSSHLKQLALRKMTDVYAKSSAVLVIDRMVSETSWNHGWPASLWQVSQCNWSRRLWTLQEGVLNPYTFFAMLEGYDTLEGWIVANHQSRVLLEPLRKYREYLDAADHEDMFIAPDELLPVGYRILYDKGSSEHLQSPALLDPIYRTICHRILQTRRVMQSHGGHIDAGRLFQSVAWRSATYVSDEAICLAILTKKGTAVLEGLSDSDERISAIIRTLNYIPARIVFQAADRMTLPGCRWMPKSFLNTRLNFDNPSKELGVPTDGGLRIRLQTTRAIRGSTIKFIESYETLISQYTMEMRLGNMRIVYRSKTPVLQCLGNFFLENGVMLFEARLTETFAACGAIIALETHSEDSITCVVPLHYGVAYMPETVQGLRPHVGPIADPDEIEHPGLDSHLTTPALSSMQRLSPKIKVDIEDSGLCEVCLT